MVSVRMTGWSETTMNGKPCSEAQNKVIVAQMNQAAKDRGADADQAMLEHVVQVVADKDRWGYRLLLSSKFSDAKTERNRKIYELRCTWLDGVTWGTLFHDFAPNIQDVCQTAIKQMATLNVSMILVMHSKLQALFGTPKPKKTKKCTEDNPPHMNSPQLVSRIKMLYHSSSVDDDAGQGSFVNILCDLLEQMVVVSDDQVPWTARLPLDSEQQGRRGNTDNGKGEATGAGHSHRHPKPSLTGPEETRFGDRFLRESSDDVRAEVASYMRQDLAASYNEAAASFEVQREVGSSRRDVPRQNRELQELWARHDRLLSELSLDAQRKALQIEQSEAEARHVVDSHVRDHKPVPLTYTLEDKDIAGDQAENEGPFNGERFTENDYVDSDDESEDKGEKNDEVREAYDSGDLAEIDDASEPEVFSAFSGSDPGEKRDSEFSATESDSEGDSDTEDSSASDSD